MEIEKFNWRIGNIKNNKSQYKGGYIKIHSENHTNMARVNFTPINVQESLAVAKLMVSAPDLLKVLISFVRDFEADYVMSDGKIVDNPNTILVNNYKLCKEAINKAL